MGTFKGLIMLPFTLVIYVLAVLVFNLIHAIPTLDYAFAALRFTRRLGVSGARARARRRSSERAPAALRRSLRAASPAAPARPFPPVSLPAAQPENVARLLVAFCVLASRRTHL